MAMTDKERARQYRARKKAELLASCAVPQDAPSDVIFCGTTAELDVLLRQASEAPASTSKPLLRRLKDIQAKVAAGYAPKKTDPRDVVYRDEDGRRYRLVGLAMTDRAYIE
jgi:hypothetical protein